MQASSSLEVNRTSMTVIQMFSPANRKWMTINCYVRPMPDVDSEGNGWVKATLKTLEIWSHCLGDPPNW